MPNMLSTVEYSMRHPLALCVTPRKGTWLSCDFKEAPSILFMGDASRSTLLNKHILRPPPPPLRPPPLSSCVYPADRPQPQRPRQRRRYHFKWFFLCRYAAAALFRRRHLGVLLRGRKIGGGGGVRVGKGQSRGHHRHHQPLCKSPLTEFERDLHSFKGAERTNARVVKRFVIAAVCRKTRTAVIRDVTSVGVRVCELCAEAIEGNPADISSFHRIHPPRERSQCKHRRSRGGVGCSRRRRGCGLLVSSDRRVRAESSASSV